MHNSGQGLPGSVHISHQHDIAFSSPQGGQEVEVIMQSPTGMRGCIITQIGSQCQIVFWVKNM